MGNFETNGQTELIVATSYRRDRVDRTVPVFEALLHFMHWTEFQSTRNLYEVDELQMKQQVFAGSRHQPKPREFTSNSLWNASDA
eukprot:6174722-Pleurochrysis_carterae.AAC.1